MSRRVFVSLLALTCACASGGAGSDTELAEKLALGLAGACPESKSDDEQARTQCAAAVTDFGLLRDTMANPFFWGGQTDDGVWELDAHVTQFHPRVFRRMYLSLYSFPREHRVEQLPDGRTLLHLKARFRNALDMGSYPYPFWHRVSKWVSYQLAEEVVLIIKDRKVLGGRRSLSQAADRELVNHQWGGQWEWRKGSEVMPFVALYGYFFSKDNPYVEQLDSAYRDVEFELRQRNCLVCHNPENGAGAARLELLNYPNQALSGRHRIVAQLEQNLMPTEDPTRGYKQGLADALQRSALLELAKKFAALGDQALQWDGEQ